ncbi:MAG: hypothetical protein MUC49_04845 [Raineya sp.]|jgi:hypothetical protein|nr:hypothetical protein [Raineya sp.]
MQVFKITFFIFFMILGFQAVAQSQEKCFSNAGLKSETTIKIKFLPNNQIAGTLTTDDYAGTQANASFTGTIKNGIIQPVFEKKIPSIGEGSEWTNKPWNIKKTKAGETLNIIFRSKNYETNKWSETPYVFEVCK